MTSLELFKYTMEMHCDGVWFFKNSSLIIPLSVTVGLKNVCQNEFFIIYYISNQVKQFLIMKLIILNLTENIYQKNNAISTNSFRIGILAEY